MALNLTQNQKDCMSAAVALLKPQNRAERTQREKDINLSIEYWQFAVELAPVATAKIWAWRRSLVARYIHAAM